MIRAACTLCSKPYQLRDEVGGRWVRCRECRAAFFVPRRYTERFARFLERAPKPRARCARRERNRDLPLAPAAPATAAVAPTNGAPRLALPVDREHLELLGLGVGGLAVMAATSFVTFLIAGVALS